MMDEYQQITIKCTNCNTLFEVKWDIDHPSAPITCPFCSHELEDEAFESEPEENDWN